MQQWVVVVRTPKAIRNAASQQINRTTCSLVETWRLPRPKRWEGCPNLALRKDL